MTREEIRRRGDRFAFLFFLIFLFVHLGIILPGQENSEVIQEISRAQRHIEHQRSELENQLGEYGTELMPARIVATRTGSLFHLPAFLSNLLKMISPEQPPEEKERHNGELSPPDVAPVGKLPYAIGFSNPADLVSPVSDRHEIGNDKRKDAEELTAEEKRLQERKEMQKRLIELDVQYLDLEKQKSAKSFSLPVLNIGVDAQVVLLLYPAFVFVGLLGILKNRSDFLKPDEPITEAPFWAMPLPLNRVGAQIWRWTAWNMLGLTSHWFVLYMVADFLFFSSAVKVYTAPALAVTSILATVTLGVYLTLLATMIGQDVTEPPPSVPRRRSIDTIRRRSR